MKYNTELIKDASMILGGLAYYATATFWLISKMSASYSLNLM
mgnify:CR=1 FL=1